MDASPHALILMLFEGALVSINLAKGFMLNHEVSHKCEAISKALAIIDEGLRASLDKEKGGEIARNLDDLYEYMGSRLIQANLKNQPEYLDEVARLLGEIKGAWEEIGKQPGVAAAAPAPMEEPPRRASLSYGKV
jgi:flagellar protein FliS